MDARPRQNGRWNTAQLLRSIEESQFGEERRHAEPRSLVSRLGMSELSCFPSSRSRRASELLQQEESRSRPALSHRRASTLSHLTRDETRRAGGAAAAAPNKPERGKFRMFPRTSRRSNPEQAMNAREAREAFDLEEDRMLELAQASERLHSYRNPTETSLRSSICKRKSSARGVSSEKKLREESQRAANLRRSSSSALSSRDSPSLASSIDGLRPQKIRVSRRAPEHPVPSSSSRVMNSQLSEYHGLMNCNPEQPERPSSLLRPRRGGETSSAFPRGARNSSASSSRSRSTGGASGAPSFSSASYRNNRSLSREHSGSNAFTRRNISNCFPALGSQARRSHAAAPTSSASAGAAAEWSSSSDVPAPLLASTLERMPSSSRAAAAAAAGAASSSSEINWQSSSSFGWDYHRPRLMAEGLAKILMALERVESDDDLTHEQLLMLEASVLLGGMGLRDQHQAWRMDVDTMSYEELLELGDKIGTVNTGLDNHTISTKMYQSIYSSKSKTRHNRAKQDFDVKCSICQEEYEKNEQLGWLDCGHQFHAECIKQWLLLKNICPICKCTALST